MSVYNVVVLSIIGAIVAIALDGSMYYEAPYAISSLCLIVCTTATLLLVFVPKVRKDQSRYITIQPKTTDLSTKIWEITTELKWMNVFIYRTYLWNRTSACRCASGCRYQSIFDLTHLPNPCIKCWIKQEIETDHHTTEIDHHTGNYVPHSFRQVCGVFWRLLLTI